MSASRSLADVGAPDTLLNSEVSPNSQSLPILGAVIPGPEGYTWCANEYETFTLPGLCHVAYGANGSFNYRYNQTGSILFTNSEFIDDPMPNAAKGGFYKLLTPPVVPIGPANYTWCAAEGGSFTLPGPSDVAYGGDGNFVTLYNQTGTIEFINANFTPDPLPGYAKNGFYKLLNDVPNDGGGYATWLHSASFFINTTPAGANIQTGVTETNFPILVRLNRGNFDFTQAQSDGRDIRFTTTSGTSLSYQIEQWDTANKLAAIWIKIPQINGNARQEVKMYWGKGGVTSESNGQNVFNTTNGYAGVLHMNESIADTVGNLFATDRGTQLGAGMIGNGRYFPGGQGLDFGSNITTLPAGSSPHTTQAWFRGATAPGLVMAWGVDGPQGKLLVQYANPPHMNVGTWFSGGDVEGETSLSNSQWVHVAHTYEAGKARLYVNGVLDASTNGGALMNIPSPAGMYIGGFNGSYDFVGEIDEVRISKVTRSANWIKMEYENQKPQQTLTGNLIQPGTSLTVSPTSLSLLEGATSTLTGQAGGADQVYWIEKRNGVETVLATNQFNVSVPAYRVSGNSNYVIQFKAISGTSTRTVDVPVTVIEKQPDPLFSLSGPTTWNGRQTISVVATLANMSAMQTAGVGNLNYSWKVNGVAVAKEVNQGTLTLKRAQGNGALSVTLTIENGGDVMTQTKIITVQQPASDAWVQRTPGNDEKPVNNQFFARDNTGYGTIHYRGSQSSSPDTVFLKVYTVGTTDVLSATYRQALVGGKYSFVAPILGGKIVYKVQYGTTSGGVDTPSGSAVTNLICGDAYIIEGQSNALAIDNDAPVDTASNSWIRSYSLSSGWINASAKGSPGDAKIGVWGMMLAKRLSTSYNMPICIINGAVGGTRIDQHRPNPADHGNPGDRYSIYATLYNRLVGAKLTHGVRALLWHQGEQDQGSGGPDGDYDYKFWQQYFVDISAAWKQDFPNILNYYVFQIWPEACGDTSRNDQLREVQRTLSRQYSNMRLMSTLGVNPGSSCHYSEAGYQVFSDTICPLVEQDHYGASASLVLTAANLKKAYFTSIARNEIALEFDQNIAWNLGALSMLYLDGVQGNVTSGSASGKIIKLQLTSASAASLITYVRGVSDWSQGNILYGSNGIAALTFADVPIGLTSPKALKATVVGNQVKLQWSGSVGAEGYRVYRSNTSGGSFVQIGSANTISFQDNAIAVGNTYYYVVSAILNDVESGRSNEVSATTMAVVSSYMAWAGNPSSGLTMTGPGANGAPTDDPDRDGLANLLELTLGGSPTVSSQSVLPIAKLVGGNWTFEYNRSDLSIEPSTTQMVEYTSDFASWTSVPITTLSGGMVTITENGLMDRVKVTLPTVSGKMFFRLKVVMNP